jgi:hypothetical protein
VGHELVGAFYRSQDGFAEWRGDQHDASSPGLPRELLARE